MGGTGSGHGIKRPDHTRVLDLWEPGGPPRRSRSVHHNLPSVFSDKPDPSLHKDRLKRLKLTPEEARMRVVRSKEIALDYKEAQSLAQRLLPKAIEKAAEMFDDPDVSPLVKVKLLEMFWDRAHGKTATNVNVTTTTDKPSELDAGSLNKRITETISRIEELTNGNAEEDTGKDRPTNLREYN